MNELNKCPRCNDIWFYVSDGDYYSGYEAEGIRVQCKCGFAWKNSNWEKTREIAQQKWNRMVTNGNGE